MGILLYGAFIAHVLSYHEQYANIGISFAVTYVLKRLIKSGGSVTNSELIGVGGYSISINEFVKLLYKIKHSSMAISETPEGKKIIGGFVGEALELLKSIGK